MDKNPSPVVVVSASELALNRSPLSNYGIDEAYHKGDLYCRPCANCGKIEIVTAAPSFKTCSRCIEIGVKRWEPIFRSYCSRKCQKAHWGKHQIEHHLYEHRNKSDIKHQQTLQSDMMSRCSYQVHDKFKNRTDKSVISTTHKKKDASTNVVTTKKNSQQQGTPLGLFIKKSGLKFYPDGTSSSSDSDDSDMFFIEDCGCVLHLNSRETRQIDQSSKCKPSCFHKVTHVEPCELHLSTPAAPCKHHSVIAKAKSLPLIQNKGPATSKTVASSVPATQSSIQTISSSKRSKSTSVQGTQTDFSKRGATEVRSRVPLPQGGDLVIHDVKPVLDNPKSLGILKKKMDDIVSQKCRPAEHRPKSKIENVMLKVFDEFQGFSPCKETLQKHRAISGVVPIGNSSNISATSTASGLPTKSSNQQRRDKGNVAPGLSDDDFHDANTDLKKDGEHIVCKQPNGSRTKVLHSNCGSSLKSDGDTGKARRQDVSSTVKLEQSRKHKGSDNMTSYDNKTSSLKKSMTCSHQDGGTDAGTPAEEDAMEMSPPYLHQRNLDNLVYVVPPYIHSRYPRRVDQYNGADPNDPFVEYSNSQSFVVQKPSQQQNVSYIGLLLSEKPNTIITQRYLVLKNAAYDGRDIELGIKREVIDYNEEGEPLYEDYLIRKIKMIQDSGPTSAGNSHGENGQRNQPFGANKASSILSQFETNTNLTSSISSNLQEYLSISEAERALSESKKPARSSHAKQRAADVSISDDVKVSSTGSVELKGTETFQFRQSTKEVTDKLSGGSESQMIGAPVSDLCKSSDFDDCQSSVTSLSDSFEDSFMIYDAQTDSFSYHFRKEQGCLFIIKKWQDYYY